METKKQQNAEKLSTPWMTLNQVSEILQLSKATIYSYTSKGILPFLKLRNRKLYFKRDDIINFVMNDKNYHKSKQQIEAEAISNIIAGK